MIGFLVKSALNMLLMAVCIYGTFFVPLGQRTLYQHLARIAETQAAQELGGALGELFDRARDEVASHAARPEGDGTPSPTTSR